MPRGAPQLKEIPDTKGLLAGLIRILPREDQVLLGLRYVDECTVPELSAILNEAESCIARQLDLLHARLGKQLNSCMEAVQ